MESSENAIIELESATTTTTTATTATTTTKLNSKFSTAFSIENLIANQNANKTGLEMQKNSDTVQELSARAMVASSALGLTNFPLYNPWLHGYFAQNHDRLAQFLAHNTCALPSHFVKDNKSFNDHVSNPQSTTIQHTMIPSMKTTLDLDNFVQARFLYNPSDSNYREKILMSDFGLNGLSAINENVQNLSLSNQFAQDIGKVLTDVALSSMHTCEQTRIVADTPLMHPKNHHSEAIVHVGVDEEFDCSGDSCSDISLTMSPEHCGADVDKAKVTTRRNELLANELNIHNWHYAGPDNTKRQRYHESANFGIEGETVKFTDACHGQGSGTMMKEPDGRGKGGI
uniref:Uncharacterized protein n=1 Tax=Glossina palpalis gambiensis TaxID=67801 RepID=A0A1B0C040_9MUSC